MNSSPHTEAADIICRPIGFIRSPFRDPVGTPIQTAAAREQTALLEVLPAYSSGLRDIEGFEFLILVTHFHACAQVKLEIKPFLDDASHGVFSTRAPARPNRIGLSIVRLLRVDGRTLHFAGNDMVDATPVLDIKPYVPQFDIRNTDRIGWFAGKLENLPGTRADDRMS